MQILRLNFSIFQVHSLVLVLIVAAVLVIVLLGFPENSLLGQKKTNTPTIKQQTLAGKRENVTNNYVIIVSFMDLK